jgi:sulfur relay (sulfurtransferase) complex TusBCD TusD component (DsrE family)
MLYLMIQHGKEGMKNELHHCTLGATAGCTVRNCERCTQVRGVKADAWFGSVLTCVELVTPVIAI